MAVVVSDLPVMEACCKTCPFKEVDGRWRDVRVANDVMARTLFKAQQVCHGTEGAKRKPRFRCKGSYDHNKVIYDRMGFNGLLK